MPSQRPIHIVLTFNDPYWALAYTVMRSICLTTHLRDQVVFHLIHTALTPAHGAAIEAIGEEFGASLRHYDPQENQAFLNTTARLPANGRFPNIVYARMLLDKILPPEVGRVIYLDCDTFVRRPIEELFNLDMQGYPIAAVADPYHDGIKRGRDIREKPSPFDAADPYFNSGVLLIDRKGLAEADLAVAIDELSRSGLLDQLYYDQDILNYVFRGKWLELPWRFNLMLPRPAHEGMGVAIFHYTGFKRPWALYSGSAFARTYRHVMTNKVFYAFWRERQKRFWLAPFRRLFAWDKS